MTPCTCCIVQQRTCAFLLLLLVVGACLPSSFLPAIFLGVVPAAALLPARGLFLARAGSTYNYTMYSGSAVTDESHFTELTTYPYVFSEDMNSAIVAILNGLLSSAKSHMSAVGEGFHTCIGNDSANLDGTACFKSLWAAAASVDCLTANSLCCPLFWRVANQDLRTTMAQVIPQTIFWNGATSVNGFYTNFSQSYLNANSNCCKPLFSTISLINLAVDAYGEWRFVDLVTAYTLLETATNLSASSVISSFGGNPQSVIVNAARSQQVSHVIIIYIAGGVDALLLLFFLFCVACRSYDTYWLEARVREHQLRTVDLVSQYHKKSAWAVIDELRSSEERGSSENGGRGEKNRQRSVSFPAAAASAAPNGSTVGENGAADLAQPLAAQPAQQLLGT
ncbi:hypothetical protein JIQ42_04289 [Leishmania sp. Namibia]|uniref:hypothetical protein n=1 Tax=Leishmania sp. Namibia TaxID=2802991 RepID=UPI001B608571|nr:hypothetical protein JIQ42_04289 [Leishmania sp. Namibia]